MKQEWFRGSHTIDTLHMRYVYMYLLYYCITDIDVGRVAQLV